MSKLNEDSRVKVPAILHLCRLGYQYISLKNAVWDTDTNIFTDILPYWLAEKVLTAVHNEDCATDALKIVLTEIDKK